MPRSSTRTILALSSIAVILLGCGAQPAAPQVAAIPTATATPIKATATPMSATATVVVPTTTPMPSDPTRTPPPATPTSSTPPTTLTIVPFGDAEVIRPADLPGDWTFYPRTIDGVAFGLPASWEIHTVSSDPSDPALDRLMEHAPELAFTMRRPIDGVETYMCACADRFATIMDVMVGPASESGDTDVVIDVFIEALEAMPEVVKSAVSHAPIPHSAGRAEAIQYRLQEVGGDGKPAIFTGTHYWIFGEDHWALVSLITSVENAEASTPLFYKIIQTLQLTPMREQPM